MRPILALILVLQVFRASGQGDSVRVLTLREAQEMASHNNPDLSTPQEKKMLTGDITSVWFKWLFQINACRVKKEQLDALSDLERIATLRYQQGDIDLLEKSSFITKLYEIRTDCLILANEILLTGNLLKQLLHYPGPISPADSNLSLYPIARDPVPNQHPDPEQTLQLENLALELDNCFIRLQYYSTAGLDHARLIHTTSRARFEAEEIDYLEYARLITESFTIVMEYLSSLYQYNHTALEIERHAY
jgi:hypothetical protein